MTTLPPKTAPLPSKRQLIDYVKQSADTPTRRDIARAFGIRGADRAWLKEVLRELEDDGLIIRHKGRRIGAVDRLPPVAVLEVAYVDDDGDALCRPVSEDEAVAAADFTIRLVQGRGKAPGIGDRVLARLRQIEEGAYEAKPIRFLGSVPHAFLAVYETGRGGGIVRSVDRRVKLHYQVAERHNGGAENGDYVRAEPLPGRPREAKVIERLGNNTDARIFSLLAIRSQEIPVEFPRAALTEAESVNPPPLGKRTDLRQIPLVTIDGPDARDFDDAVWAEPDPKSHGGWHAIVAIADVAWYVRPEQRARPRRLGARQLRLFPRPGRADAAGAAVERPLLAEAGRRAGLPRGPSLDRQQRRFARLALRARADAVRRPPHLRTGPARA